MALTGASIQAVELRPSALERYRDLLDKTGWDGFAGRMRDFSKSLRGRVVWNVNSTAQGGGVAELLAALIPYDLAAGVDERWMVIQGSPEFFEVTKTIHNLLHGVAPDDPALTDADRRLYDATLAQNAAALLTLMRRGDVAVLHDPQTAGLVPLLTAHGVVVVWRAHIGVDEPNDAARVAWRFLTPYLATASALVFSRRAYVWDGLESRRVHVIAPCIDAFSAKNRELSGGEVARILAGAKLVAVVPSDVPIVVQVSRWDRLKDPGGVLRAFADHIAPATGARLILAGPQVDGVDDDPEQPEVLAQLEEGCMRLDAATRDRVVIAQIPMGDVERNALIVNALQRRATVVVQKSLAEGFGLTVAEAMWKSRPVVASRVGGIEDQVVDGQSGILVDDPADLATFGSAVVRLLEDPGRTAALGGHARQRVLEHFLAPRHLVQQADLIISLL